MQAQLRPSQRPFTCFRTFKSLRAPLCSAKHCPGQVNHEGAGSTSSSASSSTSSSSKGAATMGRRGSLYSLGLLMAATAVQPPSAGASVTLTMRSKAEPKQYDLKGGYSITVPSDWALAYDRAAEQETGVQALFGNFRTFETLSIAKVPVEQVGLDGSSLAPGNGLSSEEWQQVAEVIVAEQRDTGGTIGFITLAQQPRGCADSSSSSSGGGACKLFPSYDVEFVVQLCRGQIQEGLGGSKRCVGINDRDLQTVTRHYLTACTRQGTYMYVVRGSAATDRWAKVAPDMLAAVQSFAVSGSAAQ